MKTLTALALFAGLFVVAGCGETATDTPTADAPAVDSGGEAAVEEARARDAVRRHARLDHVAEDGERARQLLALGARVKEALP